MLCPRREEYMGVPLKGLPTEDTWRDGKTCSYCGSLHPDEFMKLVEEGNKVEPTDKNYKAYISKYKFYYQHLSSDQQLKFIGLLNDKKIVVDMPGYFYVLPFFISAGPAHG